VGLIKLGVLLQTHRTEAMVAYGNRLVSGALKDDAQALNSLAYGLVEPERAKPSPQVLPLAEKAALRADALSSQKDPQMADTVAAVYFAEGKVDKAIATQERAIKLAAGTPLAEQPVLKEHLVKYKRARKP
jgi:hypothetical protein